MDFNSLNKIRIRESTQIYTNTWINKQMEKRKLFSTAKCQMINVEGINGIKISLFSNHDRKNCQEPCVKNHPRVLFWSVTAATTNQHRLGSLQRTETYFSQFGRSKIKAPAWPSQGPLPGSKLVPSAVSPRGGRSKELCGVFFKGANPIHEGSTLQT